MDKRCETTELATDLRRACEGLWDNAIVCRYPLCDCGTEWFTGLKVINGCEHEEAQP